MTRRTTSGRRRPSAADAEDRKTTRLAIGAVIVVVFCIYLVTLLKDPRLSTSWNDLTPDGVESNDWAIFFSIPPAH